MEPSYSDPKLKIAFFGTSDRSVPILNSLKQHFDLTLCVTKNDTKVGRHLDIRETEVKKWSKVNGVKVLAISSLKGAELEAVVEQLMYAKVDYILVADFNYMIPEQLLETFPNKVINIHFSLLPKYRGACPVQFAILNGDELTGVTYLLVDRKMDKGKIIHQIGYKLANNETSGTLYSILFDLAAENLPKVITEYHLGRFIPREQDESKASYTYSKTKPTSTLITKEDARLNWKQNAKQIEQMIRAFNPWPIVWTTVGEIEENQKKLGLSKTVLRKSLDKSLRVKIYAAEAQQDNIVSIKEIQLEGKSKVEWETFKNGYLETKAK